MPHSAPRPLPENAGLVFVGERVALTAALPAPMAERMLGTRNLHGKANADVLRPLATAAAPRRPNSQWLIDFPAHMDEREATLYELPFHHLIRTKRPGRDRWWVNPHANKQLRATLAKRERYLATPVCAEPPAWTWFESALIPDDTLLVVARDDDFIHGILAAHPFAVWWCKYHSRRTPIRAVSAYPFPWAPGTGLSALTAAQEELRHAVAKAVRGGDTESLNTAVTAAYGWPAGLDDAALLARLGELNRARSV